MHQFDHRWGSYRWDRQRGDAGEYVIEDVATEFKADPAYKVQPRYWVPEREVIARLARAPRSVIRAWLAEDTETLLSALANWILAGVEDDPLAGFRSTSPRQQVIEQGGPLFEKLDKKESQWLDDRIQAEARKWDPLSETECQQLQSSPNLIQTLHTLLDHRSPRWLMGWRDITNSTNERTVIASVLPRAGVGNKIPLFFSQSSPRLCAGLIGNLCSIVLDFVARQKVGGTTLNYYLFKQFPVFPPDSYLEADLDYIVPRVLELTYTSQDLKPWAEDLGYGGPPFGFDPDRRAQLRAELDAYYAQLYGLTRDELRFILDPAEIHGPDYPTVTFPGLKRKELALYDEYRTQRLVLEAFDRLVEQEEKIVDLPDPVPPRVPFPEEEIAAYLQYLIYAWLMEARRPLPVITLVKAFSLLKDPERIVTAHKTSEEILKWRNEFNEPLDCQTLRPILEEMRERSAFDVRLTESDEVLLVFKPSPSIPSIPLGIRDDARFSLTVAQREVDSGSAVSTDNQNQVDEIDALLKGQ